MTKMKQLDRLKIVVNEINNRKDKTRGLSICEKIAIKKLELLKKHPEYEDKFHNFEIRDIYLSSSHETILCVEVARIKN